MNLLRLLLVALVCAGFVGAQDHGGAEGAAQQAAHEASDDHGHGPAKPTMEMDNSEFFTGLFSHLVPTAWGDPFHNDDLVFYNVNGAQIIAIVLMILIFGAVLGSFGRPGRSSWLVRVFRGFCMWIREEMVFNVMGEEEGRRFAPFFLYMFFFIAFMNLLGLVPQVGITATATIFVTGTLAIITFAVMVLGGMIKQGPFTFWKNLLPHGLPFWLVPLMMVLETVGLLVKPFALTIRLFANMLAGHLVIYSFIGMIFLFAKMLEMSGMAYLTAIPGVGMGVFISIIEAFVALLQAYIFTYLSIIFVQQSLHPAH